MDIAKLTTLAAQYPVDTGRKFQGLPNLSVYTRNAVSEIEASVYEPVMCLILQGGKITSIGDQHVELRVGDALVVSHDLPVLSRIMWRPGLWCLHDSNFSGFFPSMNFTTL